jgi:4-diphosphocytidyl-2-C-methyl-D-erythritol kinase
LAIRIKARAKINWTLDLVGKRPDGYHLIDTLMQSVELYDTLEFAPPEEPADGIELVLQGYTRVPEDENNLVLRAGRLLAERTGLPVRARVTLTKRIPVGAGMGGGSADAAAALAGLNRFCRLQLKDEDLLEMAPAVGADVPFCVCGGLQRACGIGEQLERLPCLRPAFLVIIQPCRGLSTRDIFARVRLDEIQPHQRPDNAAAAAALVEGRLPDVCAALGNVLQAPAVGERPEIAQAIQALEHFGALRAQMTGSGSAVFGVFETAREAQAAWESARQIWRRCWTTRTASRGLVFRQ